VNVSMPAQTLAEASAPPATQATARYAYVVERNAPQDSVVSYAINPQTGYLRALESIALTFTNSSIVVDPSNKFLYVPDGFEIFGYKITSNGSLQALTGSPFALFGGSTLIFTPNGKFAYSNLESEFSLNPTTGVLTRIGSADTGGKHLYIAINPAGTFVYVLNGDDTISVFSVDQTSGVLTEITGSPFASGETNLDAEVVSPNGKFLFVTTGGNSTSGLTAAFSINSTTGALTPVAGSPFSTPGGGNGVVINPTTRFLYFAGDNLSAYSINSSTGALTLTAGSPYTFPSFSVASSITMDPTAKFLYAVLSAGNFVIAPGILTYSINSTTGALTEIAAKGADEGFVEALTIAKGSTAVAYSPKFAYATNQGSKTVSEWTINDTTGGLTAITGSPLSDTDGPLLVATTPSGAFVYTGNSNNSISEYKVGATTGALNKVSGSPIKGFGSVNALVVDPSSSFLLVLDSTKQAIDTYTINAKTGALTSFSTFATIAHAQTLTLDPTGLVAVVSSPTTVQTYNMAQGSPTSSGGGSATTTNPPTAVAVDQSSQYILLAEAASKTVVTLSLMVNNSLKLPQLSSAATGNNPSAILAEPSGKYVYVANSGDGTISAYSLNNSTGALKQIGSAVKAAAGTDSLAASNDGKYLYATDKSAGLVSIFKINSTGTLTAAGSATTGTSPTSIATTGTNQ